MRYSPVHQIVTPRPYRSNHKSTSLLAAGHLLLRVRLSGLVHDGVEQLSEDALSQELREDVAQLALGRNVVDGKFLVDDPVTQPHECDREGLISIAVAPLPCWKQSSLVVAEDASATEESSSKLSEYSAQQNSLLLRGTCGD